jgi:hypothetical protein
MYSGSNQLGITQPQKIHLFGRTAVSRARSFLVYQFDMPASFADKATSHSTKPASWQVAGYARLLALHPKKMIF